MAHLDAVKLGGVHFIGLHLLIRVAIAVAVASIACFGLFSVNDLRDENRSGTAPVILAYPAALIGIGGLAMVLVSTR